ncbi:MAG TPA: hypothetical protein VGK67_09235 [Myxococcales bacterium]|jgi:hypothetical protein
MSELKVGGEVEGYCTKCKMVLAHTVLAIWAGQIKKVRCNTCMGEHAFRKAEPGAATSSPSSPKPSKPRAVAASKPKAAAAAEVSSSYEELVSGKDRSSARPFNLKQKFAVGDLMQHPTFGLGVVAAARGLDKIDVAFPGSVKTLQHNKGAGPASFARPLPARTPDVAIPEDESKQDPAAETSDETGG